MKRLILAIAVAAAPMIATAAETPPPAPAPPQAITLPIKTLAQIGLYLSDKPYKDVAPMLDVIHACWQEQTPNAQGVMIGHGGCPTGKEMHAPITSKAKPAPDAAH